MEKRGGEMNEIDEWLTLKQAAELVGVTPRTVQNWIKNGKVRGYQVVGRIRVKRSDVDALYQPKSPDSPGNASGDRS